MAPNRINEQSNKHLIAAFQKLEEGNGSGTRPSMAGQMWIANMDRHPASAKVEQKNLFEELRACLSQATVAGFSVPYAFDGFMAHHNELKEDMETTIGLLTEAHCFLSEQFALYFVEAENSGDDDDLETRWQNFVADAALPDDVADDFAMVLKQLAGVGDDDEEEPDEGEDGVSLPHEAGLSQAARIRKTEDFLRNLARVMSDDSADMRQPLLKNLRVGNRADYLGNKRGDKVSVFNRGDNRYGHSPDIALDQNNEDGSDDHSELEESFPTRRHFRDVANLVRASPDPMKRQELADHHAEIFKRQNPRFDHVKWHNWIGTKTKAERGLKEEHIDADVAKVLTALTRVDRLWSASNCNETAADGFKRAMKDNNKKDDGQD